MADSTGVSAPMVALADADAAGDAGNDAQAPKADAATATMMASGGDALRSPDATRMRDVTALTNACDWRPESVGADGEPAPPMCDDGTFEQSCVPDPCGTVLEACQPKCAATCESCARRCVSACDSCKKTCQDEPCKRACATTTATCEASCVAGNRSCRDAKCEPAHAACVAKHKAVWDASHCGDACTTLIACLDKCDTSSPAATQADPARCEAACSKTYKSTCAVPDANLCQFSGPHPFGPFP